MLQDLLTPSAITQLSNELLQIVDDLAEQKIDSTQFLNQKQAMAHLGMSYKTFKEHIEVKRPPVYNIDGLIRYKTSELDEWMKQFREGDPL